MIKSIKLRPINLETEGIPATSLNITTEHGLFKFEYIEEDEVHICYYELEIDEFETSRIRLAAKELTMFADLADDLYELNDNIEFEVTGIEAIDDGRSFKIIIPGDIIETLLRLKL